MRHKKKQTMKRDARKILLVNGIKTNKHISFRQLSIELAKFEGAELPTDKTKEECMQLIKQYVDTYKKHYRMKPKNSLQPKNKDSWTKNTTYMWLQLRQQVLDHYGRVCMKCGAVEKIEVDHIYPKSEYPAMEYDFNNLQVLCRTCNQHKGISITDYRNI